jgi:uncharacterized membrane protein YhaH (DUF805 family)
MNWYLGPIRKYATFSGRASRKEYWMFFLWNIIIAVVLGFIAGAAGLISSDGTNWLVTVYQIFILIPSIAVGVRRMHDAGHSGWWLLLPLVNLIFAVQESQPGDNKYGPNPHTAAPSPAAAAA